MATQAHCAYCFESLVASFEKRQPLSLVQIEDLWEQYQSTGKGAGEDDLDGPREDEDEEDEERIVAKTAAISRLMDRFNTATSSSSSLPSTQCSEASSTPSKRNTPGSATPASSLASIRSGLSKGRDQMEKYPLFVTWNTHSQSGNKSLRGCIGTFDGQELESGLRSYALTSAFKDTRFSPIPFGLIPSLSNHVTLLTNFSAPKSDPMDWTLGVHGIRIFFKQNSRSYGATYLPDVAVEQGWSKEEAIISLMRKAGWTGRSSSWARTWRDGAGELITYEGKQVGLGYQEWREFMSWTETETLPN